MLPHVAPVVSPAVEQFARIPFSSVQALADCSRAEIITYNALALHADAGTGHCWPGRARLANITHLNESRVSKATAGLERKGLIRKQVVEGVRVEYFLLPQTPRPMPDRLPLPELEPTPDRFGTPPLTDSAPEQTIEQPIEQRAVEPEPPPPEPPAVAALSQEVLRNARTLAPDTVAPAWIEQARLMRPELSVEVIHASAESFLDYHRSRATTSACWMSEWRRWIRRERAPRAAQSGPQATPAPRRYPIPTAPTETPESALAAFQRHMKKLGAVQQPDGTWRRPDAPPAAPPVAVVVAPTPRPLAPAPRAAQRVTAEETRRLAELAAEGEITLRELTERRAQIAGAVGG